MSNTRQFCTFWLGPLYCGVDVRHVSGVVAHQPMTRVPLAPPPVRGLMNLRGDIICGVDLLSCLGLEATDVSRERTNIILKATSGPVSLLVDRVGEVVTVDEEQLEPPPETLRGKIREITDCICQIDESVLLLLQVEAVVDVASRTDIEY